MRIRWLVAGWALASAVRRLSRRTGVTDAEAYGTLPGGGGGCPPRGPSRPGRATTTPPTP
jgi:hypothetical protein